MKCPDCGMDNLDGSIFCDDCGANLQQEGGAVIDDIVKLAPKEEGNVLNETYEVMSILEKGVINRYKAVDKKTNKDVLILEHEFRPRPSVIEVEGEEIPKITTPLEEDPFSKIYDFFKGIEHQGLIKVMDYFQDKGRSYLVEEFFSLESLEQKINLNAKIDELQIMKWGSDICNGIDFLHKRNVIHRNLKPSTILVSPSGEIKITGFERARLKSDAHMDVLVNHGYTPPEGFGVGKSQINESSDLFSIAAIMYRLATLYKPGIEQQGPYITFPAFKDLGVRVSYPSMEKVISKALSSAQEKRHKSLQEFAEELQKVMETPPVNYIEKGAYIRIRGAMKTDVGHVREINQDSMLSMQLTMNECSEFTQPLLFIVADGMGGVADGEVASSLAIRLVAKHVSSALLDRDCSFPLDSAILSKAIEQANGEIYDYSQEEASRKGMGSTLTSALLIGNRLIVGHVGDTRAYLMNSKGIKQITEDHSLIGRLLKMGQLTPEEAKNSPQKNLIYRALGTNPQIEVDIYEEEMKPDDIVLICCDGLWDYFPEEEFHKIVSKSKDFDKTAKKLIELANERGGKDNITVIIFQLLSIECD